MGDNHKIFSFRRKSYVFTNYIQEYEVSHELFYAKLHSMPQKAQDTLKSNGISAPVYAALEELIHKIVLLDVDAPVVLDGFQFAPTTLYGKRLYSVQEMESLPISLSQLIMEQAYIKYFDQDVQNQITSDIVANDNTTVNFDAGDLISSVTSGIGDIIQSGASAVGTVINAGTNAVGSLTKDGASVFKSVGDTLGSTLSSLVVPIAVIGGLVLVAAVVGFIIYRKYMSGGFDSNNSGRSKNENKRRRVDSSDESNSSSESSDDERDYKSDKKRTNIRTKDLQENTRRYAFLCFIIKSNEVSLIHIMLL